MKQLTLDYSKWRSGRDGNFKLGEGYTKLLNEQGFMCCLGQISLQLNPTLTNDDILGKESPACVNGSRTEIELLTYGVKDNEIEKWNNSSLARLAMCINDDKVTTPKEKIESLTELFLRHGYFLNVINQPE